MVVFLSHVTEMAFRDLQRHSVSGVKLMKNTMLPNLVHNSFYSIKIPQAPRNIMATVIIGAGIIGSSTAYYLSESSSTTPPSSIHLIESCPELFASASGYAAGFLARDWFAGSVAPLGALSFDLHKQLAEENNGWEKWGYSRSTGTSLISRRGERGEAWCREGNSRAEAAGEHEFVSGKGPAWLARRNDGKVEVISEGDSTAQVFVPTVYAHFPLP